MPEQWLMIEWPDEEARPPEYWQGSLTSDISLTALVTTVERRLIIERDDEELRQELGQGTVKGEVGAGSIMTPHLALPPTAF